MYNTGVDKFLTAVCSPNRTIDTRVAMRLSEEVPLGTNDIVSYKITYSSTAGKSFTPGGFVASLLELSLNASSDKLKETDFKTDPISDLAIEAGIQVGNSMVFLPMGTFYPDKDGVTVSDGGQVTVKASDIPPILYTQFSSDIFTLPCTVEEALSSISSAIGIPIHAELDDFPNLAIELAETFSLTTTYREAIMYAAETLGGYSRMGRNGEIYIKKLFSGLVDLGCVLDDNYLFSVTKQESTVKPFQSISIKANEDDLGVTVEVGGIETGCKYDILDNPLTYGHPGDFLQGLINPTSFNAFYPSNLSFQGRPDLDVGDVLQYAYKGVTYILPVCNHVFEYNGGFKTTVESIGSDTLKVSSVDSGLKTKITALRQNINSLFRDLTQTQSQIIDINGNITEMSTVLQTVELLKSSISKIEGDINQLSTLTQTADGLRLSIETLTTDLASAQGMIDNTQQTLLTYFDFLEDGLTIGIGSSNIKLNLANNRVQFIKDDDKDHPVAYFSEGKLYVMDAHFLQSLVLGNFEFVPRTNGNLSLRYRG